MQQLITIPFEEKEVFQKLIKEYRSRIIMKASVTVDNIFKEYPKLLSDIKKKKVSSVITEARELAWQKYLAQEAEFNTSIMKYITSHLATPKSIAQELIKENITELEGKQIETRVLEVCGEYAGRVYPYIYELSLSNTQSRRSRAGATFEQIIYKIYTALNYPFDSQGKVGKKVFEQAGLGKLVDSILPNIQSFQQRRDKIIIGTMKTTLRERWQEVSEEIQRTNIPKIYLLTVDEDISVNKVSQMANHNIILVCLLRIKNTPKLRDMKNIISFEDYLFNEIPPLLAYWKR